MELFSQIIGNDPYYPGAYNLAGDILKNRGRLDESINMYQRALRGDSVNRAALNGLFTANTDMFNFTAAEQWFAYAEKNAPIFSNNDIFMMRARFSAAQGKNTLAVEYLKRIVFSDKKMKGKATFIKGEIAFYQQQHSQTIVLLAQLLNKNNDDSIYHLANGQIAIHLAYAYQQLEQFDKANEVLNNFENYLQKSTSKKANNSSFYFNMMTINTLKGNDGQALSYFQSAIDTGWVETWRVDLDPFFVDIKKSQRFKQMLGGVIAKLENMKANSDTDASFLLVESN